MSKLNGDVLFFIKKGILFLPNMAALAEMSGNALNY